MRHTDERPERDREPEPPPPPRPRREQSYEEAVSNVGLDPDEPAVPESERKPTTTRK